jgi:hypothetical protein
MNSEDLRRIEKLIVDGHHMDAIKAYRAIHPQANLLDAKSWVEAKACGKTPLPPGGSDIGPTVDQLQRWDQAILGGRHIDAVKIAREIFQCGLAEAKTLAENRRARLREIYPHKLKKGCLGLLLLALPLVVTLLYFS